MQRRSRVVAQGLLLLGLATMAGGSTARAEVTITPVTSDVVMVTGRVANMAVLRTSAGLVVVDTLISPLHAREARAELAVRFPGAPVRWVVNTRYHLDHNWGNQEYPEATVIAHRRTCERVASTLDGAGELLRGEEELAKLREALTAAPATAPSGTELADQLRRWELRLARYSGFRLRPAELCLDGDLMLAVGGKTVEVRHLGPGHTDGDLVVRFVEDQVLATGDLVFHGSYPVLDLDGGVELVGWAANLERLAGDDGVAHVVPGHGPAGGPPMLAAQAAYLRQLWAAVLAARQAGRTLEQAQAEIPPPAGDELGVLFDDRAANVAAAWTLAERAASR